MSARIEVFFEELDQLQGAESGSQESDAETIILENEYTTLPDEGFSEAQQPESEEQKIGAEEQQLQIEERKLQTEIIESSILMGQEEPFPVDDCYNSTFQRTSEVNKPKKRNWRETLDDNHQESTKISNRKKLKIQKNKKNEDDNLPPPILLSLQARSLTKTNPTEVNSITVPEISSRDVEKRTW